jgi:hypothetical protein
MFGESLKIGERNSAKITGLKTLPAVGRQPLQNADDYRMTTDTRREHRHVKSGAKIGYVTKNRERNA